MHIPKAICGACKVTMRPKKNGVVVEMMIQGEIGVPDRPYYKIEGDEWECPECGQSIVTGMGCPIVEHWHPEYGDVESSLRARFAR